MMVGSYIANSTFALRPAQAYAVRLWLPYADCHTCDDRNFLGLLICTLHNWSNRMLITDGLISHMSGWRSSHITDHRG